MHKECRAGCVVDQVPMLPPNPSHCVSPSDMQPSMAVSPPAPESDPPPAACAQAGQGEVQLSVLIARSRGGLHASAIATAVSRCSGGERRRGCKRAEFTGAAQIGMTLGREEAQHWKTPKTMPPEVISRTKWMLVQAALHSRQNSASPEPAF